MIDLQLPTLPQLNARTCNEAAALVFLSAGKTSDAFVERESDPLSVPPKRELLDLLDDFWALTLSDLVYVTSENQFRQYLPSTGLYELVQETTLIGQLITNLNLCAKSFPSSLKFESFVALKNRQRLKSVIERAKDLLAVDSDFFKPQSPHHIYLANGVLNIVTRRFIEYSPRIHVREKLPVKYDPEAKCEMFLTAFLHHILSSEDIDLLQRFCSQLLLGQNQSQNILVLTGDSGWGKSTLIKVLGTLLGWDRVGIIREQLYRDASELSYFIGKHLLYAPDMHSNFLNRKEATIFKQLVGNDPLWAASKEERRIIEGTFPVILACNGKPHIMLDQDTDAWLRRLVVLSFKKPANHDKHKGTMAQYLIDRELPGILNWLLEGYGKLYKTSLQLTQSLEQRSRTAVMLMASESPAVFVRTRLVKKKDAVMGMAELYEVYQGWCRTHQLPPFSSKEFYKIVKAELEMGLGLKYRHDLVGEGGKWMRGWKGLALVEGKEDQDAKKVSEVSEVSE